MLHDFFFGTWHWSLAGFALALVMLTLTYFGNFFGLSSTYRVFCAIGGAGKRIPFFDFNWKDQVWNLCFVAGIVLGAGLTHLLLEGETLTVSEHTQLFLYQLGIIERVDGEQLFPLLPPALFELSSPLFRRSFWLLLAGGFLSGFGARYAGGCTSGHFISGLSNLQIPSLITVIFFILGGVIFTNLLLPFFLRITA